MNDALIQHRDDYKATKKQIKERRKKCFKGFVYWVNGKSAFFKFLTCTFSAISSRFKKEKNVQNDLIAEKKNLKISIQDQKVTIANMNDEIDQLAEKLLFKKPIVDNLEIEYSNHLA